MVKSINNFSNVNFPGGIKYEQQPIKPKLLFQSNKPSNCIVLYPAKENNLLGEGGQGSVVLLRDKEGSKYAAKVFENRADFNREVRAYKIMGQHDGIVKYFDHGLNSRWKYTLIFEYINGINLAEFIKKQDNFCKRFPKDALYAAPMRLVFVQQLLSSVEHLKLSDISHCDLKPANVMMAEHGNLKIIDFGLCKYLDSPTPKNVYGTKDYMAPEVLYKSKANFSKVDEYSLSNILLELLTGFRLQQNYSDFYHFNQSENEEKLNEYPNFLNPEMVKKNAFKNEVESLREDLKNWEKVYKKKKSNPSLQCFSASGSFFPPNKIKNSADAGDFFSAEREKMEALNDQINEELRTDVISRLQQLQSKNRAQLQEVQKVVEKMVSKYLTPEIWAGAVECLQNINQHTVPVKRHGPLFVLR